MKKAIIYISILILTNSCSYKSDCYGGRLIVDEVEEILRFEKRIDSILIQKNQEKFVACNYPDSMIIGQLYKVKLKILKTEPHEKWVGQPCEITKIEIQPNQKIESLEINKKTLFTGGGGKTDREETITVGIYITKISELEIEYEFTELIDWKQKRELKGKATIQGTNNDKIETQNGEFESAFRFVDLENNIEIFVTKDFKINQTKARLIEKNTSKISGLMYNK
ncbi:MAG: hypothetical protein GY705_27320 [Bacteroidetes bacterium]|nr:hypothetical protein [Bacteroidota bacterium]